ncbi:hypothetical protein MYO4S_00258 [Serratia phage 4S]|nr:hypothetical protein MYO4S_00258 [Serratia phage 4S]
MKLYVLMVLIPFCALAWVKDPGYSYESLWSVQGLQLETTGYLKKNIEIVYAPDTKQFGVSFYNYPSDKTVMDGTFKISSCERKLEGNIRGPYLDMTYRSKEILTEIFTECKTPIFMRVYNEIGNYATYRIIHTKGVPFKEFK